ncbi:MAG: hypothetical protein WCQ21_38340, partial [Verrucomicrobiota bacterium]
APACTERCAGEGELLFALTHSGSSLPELVEGVNRPVLPVFWRFCPIAKTAGGRQRPSGQAMREKQRGSVANRAGGGQCREKPAFKPAWKTTILSRLEGTCAI